MLISLEFHSKMVTRYRVKYAEQSDYEVALTEDKFARFRRGKNRGIIDNRKSRRNRIF